MFVDSRNFEGGQYSIGCALGNNWRYRMSEGVPDTSQKEFKVGQKVFGREGKMRRMGRTEEGRVFC